MTRRAFPERVAHGGEVANRLAAVLFCAVVFFLFAPLALHYLAAGDLPGVIICTACALGLGRLLAPGD